MVFQLPRGAEVNKFVAKAKFYERVNLSSRLQNAFISKIQKITWRYKLAEDTIGIPKTDNVTEIQIFEIALKEQVIPQNVLKVIDKVIPYHILYIFTYGHHYAYGITLKEDGKAVNYYFSEWNQSLPFDFTGIDLEKVYQKLVKLFLRSDAAEQKDFQDVIGMDDTMKSLEREIITLENRIRKQKQFNRKVDLNKTLLAKKNELQSITTKYTKSTKKNR